jgi:hypothetical protein
MEKQLRNHKNIAKICLTQDNIYGLRMEIMGASLMVRPSCLIVENLILFVIAMCPIPFLEVLPHKMKPFILGVQFLIQNGPSLALHYSQRNIMYRNLTSMQVIDHGNYLNMDFDPSHLTVSQILGILVYHNVQFPTQYNKPQLLHLFEDNITANSAKLKEREHQRKQSLPSDIGIIDGLTG